MSIPPPPPAPGPYDQQPSGSSAAGGYGQQPPSSAAPGPSPAQGGYGAPAGSAAPAPAAKTPWYKKWWTWLIGCGCLLLAAIAAILVILLIAGTLTGGPRGTVDDFVSAWNKRDCQALEKLTTGTANDGLLEGCTELVKSAKNDPEMMPELTFDATDTTVKGDHAQVDGTMSYTENGKKKSEPSRFTLTKVDGDWKIDDFGTI